MGARILIIEDNPANLELMRYLLSAFGHVVASASSGEEGLAWLQQDAPDFIICDVQLPRMSGIDVAKEIKRDRRLKDIPLVAVTAFAMLGDRDKLLQAGFDGYIAKPIDPETFPRQIDEFLPPIKRSGTQDTHSELAMTAGVRPRNGITILAVDNLQVQLDFTSSMLEPIGYTVITATSVDEALRLAREVTPDIIVSDVCMPVRDGYELIVEIKKDPRLSGIPFVFLTSTALDTAARQKGLALGATRYLFRPIEPEQLLADIEACLAQPSRL